MMVLIRLTVVLLLAWVFAAPEQLRCRGRRWWTVFALTGLSAGVAVLSLAGATRALSELFIGWPLLWGVVFRPQLRRILPPAVPAVPMAAIVFALLLTQEVWVAVDNGGPVAAHLIHYAAFYAGIALTLAFCYRRWRYSVRQTFVVGGLWGVLVEQEFLAVKLAAAGQWAESLALGIWVFPVYGLYLAAPRLLFSEECERSAKTFARPGVLFAAIVTAPLATWLLGAALLKALGMSPDGVR